MTEIELRPPLKGLDKSLAIVEQPPSTSSFILNMRSEDPFTGRVRLSQRSGSSKYTNPSAQIGTTKIQHGTSLTYDSRRVTYAATPLVSGTTRWSVVLPQSEPCINVKNDAQGNVYAIDGRAGVVKYNSAGIFQWRVALPVQDPLHTCRALCVDDEANVYVGVSGPFTITSAANVVNAANQKNARIFKIVQDLENKNHIDDASFGAWVIEPGGFIEDMAFQGGFLYCGINFPDSWGADVHVYGSLGTAVPQLAWHHADRETPFPINAIAVKADGSYFTSHEPFNGRSQGDPRFPLNSPRLTDWTPADLTNKDQRIWSWFDPNDLATVNELEEDGEVLNWFDKSGNDRNWFKHTNYAAPRFNKAGIGGQASVRFAGGSGTPPTAAQALQSSENVSTAFDFADQEKTVLPCYSGATDAEKAMFALFIVIRPTIDAQVRWIMGQSISNVAATPEWELMMNRDEGNALDPSAGKVCVFDGTGGATAAGGDDNRPAAGLISNASIQGAVITVLNDGGRTSTNPKSLFRLNGTGIDRWDSVSRLSVLPTELGHHGGATNFPTTGVEFYKGDISDILVLRDFTGATDGLLSHPYAPTAGGDTSGDSEAERLEGWGAWKNGLSHLLPGGHPFARTNGPPRNAGVGTESKKLLLLSTQGIVAKWGASKGDLKWVVTGRIAAGAFPAVSAAGVGYGVTTDAEGNVYTTGPICDVATIVDHSVMRKIIDNGDTATIAGVATGTTSTVPSSSSSAWSKTSNDITGDGTTQSWQYKYPRLACDTKNNVYVPWHEMTSVAARSVTIWDKTGQFHLSGAYSVTTPSGLIGYAVAIDPHVPDYGTDFPGGSAGATARAEYFYVASDEDPVGHSALHSVRFSQVSTTTGSPRTAVHLAVSAGIIKRFSSSAVSTIAGAGTLTIPQLDPTSQFIGSFIINSEVFFIDGKQYRVFNPRNDTVLEWKSRTGGAMPERCKLGCTWRSRAVLARGVDDPNGWHMSGFGDPYDWDRFPPIITPTQAISGSNSLVGQPPDIINALMPWSDDIMDFGCDHSIWRLTGDPMAGGQLDCVSQTIGVAFGPSWCKAPDGTQYFFGSRGGVYIGGYPPIPLTEGRVEREMADFDFSAYYPLLQWNDRDNGLHVFQVPYGIGGTIKRHWFWSKKTNGWFPDEFGLTGTTTVQPTTAWTIDGDSADDRRLLIGCEDGYVRSWDEDATSDDGILIDAYARFGPFQGAAGQRARFTRLYVALADDQDGCRYELSTSQTVDSPGLAVAQGGLSPGENAPGGTRASGNNVWLLLRNAQVQTRFAVERASIQAFPAGRARERLRG